MKVLVIGCGGTGINWSAQVESLVKNGQNDVSILLVDGSESNLRDLDDDVLDTAEKWICPKTDGAGKDRAAKVKEYKEYLASKIHEIPEADLYIMCYSTSGGTGSVFGPEFTLALLQADKAVVGITTTSTASRADARNTYNVIRGLSAYARKSGKPVVNFIQNGDATPTVEVDKRVKSAIEALIYATSDSLGALDRSDLKAFFDYTRHGIDATLTELFLTPELEEIRKDHGKYLTTLSVIPNLETEEPNVDELTNLRAVGGSLALYFGTRIDRMSDILTHAKERTDHFEKLASSHSAITPFGDDDDMEF